MNLLLPSLAGLTNSKFVVCRFFLSLCKSLEKKSYFYRELNNSAPMHVRTLIGMYNLTEDERKKLSEKQCVDHSAELHEIYFRDWSL